MVDAATAVESTTSATMGGKMTLVARTFLTGVIVFALACSGGKPASPDGGGGGGGGDGGQPETPEGLFVTMQDATGNVDVFRDGNNIARSCGERLNALIEPGCPSLSMYFYVHNPEFPDPVLELYVQGGYGFVMRSDGALHHRTVSEIAIDAQDGQIASGHYRLSLDEAPGPSTDVWGRFALCTEAGSTLEPCRNM
jgi:hypothetical protein